MDPVLSSGTDATCCFCGGELLSSEAVQIGFSAPEDRQAIQGAYSHARCLAERLHADVLLLPDISDRAERERSEK